MKFKKHIPNSITCCNLISGCIATSYAFAGDAKIALLWIIMGAVFDFFDGMSARLLHVSSPVGKELDSLADDVTFGVAPATILFNELAVLEYPTFLEPLRAYLPYVAFLMAAFSASCYLWVSELPMFALKFKHWGWRGNEVKYSFALLSLCCLLYFGWLEAWWIIITLYLLASVLLRKQTQQKS